MMKSKDTAHRITPRQESRFVKMAIEALQTEFPNPERISCPDPEALKQIARHRLSTPDAEDLIDHIATCAPCFKAYSEYRHRRTRRRSAKLVFVCAVGLTAIASIWLLGQRNRLSSNPPVASRPQPPVVTATLDLRSATTERSAVAPHTAPAAVPHLSRGILKLTIQLPIGTEDGAYVLELRSGKGAPVASASGRAAWDGSAEVLSTIVDLRKVSPGLYTLAIRKTDGSWRNYPLLVE